MDTNTNFDAKIIDSSIVLAELLPDEKNSHIVEKYFTDFFERKLDFIAPSLLKYEVVNSFRSQFLRKRLSVEKTQLLLEKFLSWSIIYKDVDFKDVLKLAILTNTTVYDASYLYLSKIYDLKLLTLDKKLSSL